MKLWLAFMAYVTPKEYAPMREHNDGLNRQRRRFVADHLKDVPLGGKGEDPPPPTYFMPRSPAEARLVREYAFLWLATEPEKLPTHHYGMLSVWHWPATIEIHDAKWEYDEIVEALERIVTRYENETNR